MTTHMNDTKETARMDSNVAETLRRALADGDITGEQVLNLLVEVRSGMEARHAEESGIAQVDATDLVELAAELRAASVAIGRAAVLIERIAPARPTATATALADAATLRAVYLNGLPRKNTYRVIAFRLGWGMNKTTNAIRAYRSQSNGVSAGRERVS